MISARIRGRVDQIINGSFWLGIAFGAALSTAEDTRDPDRQSPDGDHSVGPRSRELELVDTAARRTACHGPGSIRRYHY